MALLSSKAAPKRYDYQWQGINKQGQAVQGELSAKTRGLAKAELQRQGFVVRRIQLKSSPLFSFSTKKISTRDLALFIRQLTTLLNAGIPLLQAFDSLSKGQKNPSLEKLINTLKMDIKAGMPLSQVFAKHPQYFDKLMCHLIFAGEQSGTLETILAKIANYKENMQKIKTKIKKALFYPSVILIVALGVTLLLLLFVVPQFKSLFAGLGAQLPSFTLGILGISAFIQQFWWLVGLLITLLSLSFLHLKRTSPYFSYQLDKCLLKTPLIGLILQKAAIARFARTLATTTAAGLAMLDALSCTAGTVGNQVYQAAILKIREQVATGFALETAMRAYSLFSTHVLQMVAVGEESGTLEAMLHKIADYYEDDVAHAVDGLSSLIEPILMIILGIIMGSLIIAMYLPIFKLGSVV